MARFVSVPSLSWAGGSRPWIVQTPAVYVTDVVAEPRQRTIRVPAGYRTDLASVPRLPFIYWRVGNRAVLAAILHDWLWCHEREDYSPAEVDRIFLEAMHVANDPPTELQRLAMYAGVRIGRAGRWARRSVMRLTGRRDGQC